jgi:MID domain of pPIWI_RE
MSGIAMRDHVARGRGGRAGVACAIVEMSSSLRGMGPRDPYVMARQHLAKQRVLPQVVLVDDEAPEEKYRSAVRDWFRMLGVHAAFEDRLPLLPAAFTVIQRNDEVVGGCSIKGQAFPLSVRVQAGGIIECALLDEAGAPNWMYSQKIKSARKSSSYPILA